MDYLAELKNTEIRLQTECICHNPGECRKRGYYIVQNFDNNGYIESNLAECEKYKRFLEQKKYREIIEKTMPGYFMDKELSNFEIRSKDSRRAFNIVNKFLKENLWREGYNLGFYGRPGVGKSHLSAALGREVVYSGGTFMIWSFPTTIPDVDKLVETYNMFKVPDVMVFDDIGPEFINPMISKVFYETVKHRYEAGKSTIFSTNYTVAKFEEVIGERIFGKIKERLTEVIINDCTSYRDIIRKNKFIIEG